MSFDKGKQQKKSGRKKGKKKKNVPNPKIYVIFCQKQKEKQFTLRVLRASASDCIFVMYYTFSGCCANHTVIYLTTSVELYLHKKIFGYIL